MKSNFEFLDKEFPVLSQFGKKAEAYLYSDSNSCLMKLGMIGETVVNLMFTYDRIMPPSENTAVNRIGVLFREGLLTQDLVDILHALRKVRNKAVHENYSSVEEGKVLLQMAHSLCEWFMQTYGDWNYAAVAAVNKFAGTSVSATGLICGAFMAALAFIGNIFVALWNLVVDVFVMIYNLVGTVANFIGNVFNDPVGAVCRLFFDLADTVLSVLQALASAIDTIFGSNLAGSVQGWRDSLGGWVDSTFGKGEEVMEKLNADDLKLDRFEYGAAFDMGYEFGQGVEDTVGGLFDFSAMDSLGAADGLDAFNLGNTLDGIYGNTGDTAGNTAAMSDALDIAEEDLAYLRDIAEREAINRFTTAEIHVEQHNENHISSDTDLDGIMDAWANDFAEKLDVSEEGVHE